MKPITPAEVGAAKVAALPPEVFKIFNDFIAKKWDGHSARFKMKHVARALEDHFFVNFEVIKERGYLDIEEAYRMAGWKVYYDNPGYCESYDATYEFSLK